MKFFTAIRWVIIALFSGVALGLYLEQTRQRRLYEADQARRQRENDEIWASFTPEQKADYIVWREIKERDGYDS
jgi:type II secretory pathway component PulL